MSPAEYQETITAFWFSNRKKQPFQKWPKQFLLPSFPQKHLSRSLNDFISYLGENLYLYWKTANSARGRNSNSVKLPSTLGWRKGELPLFHLLTQKLNTKMLGFQIRIQCQIPWLHFVRPFLKSKAYKKLNTHNLPLLLPNNLPLQKK